MSSTGARWLKLLAGLALTIGFAWLFVRGLEPAVLGRAFARLSVSAVSLALVFLAVGWAMRIAHWWYMLRTLESGLPFAACIQPFFAGMALNNLLPLRAGDAFRIIGFRRQLRSPALRVAGTVVIEHILNMAVLLAIFFLCLVGLPVGTFPQGFILAATWGAGVLLVAVLCFLLLAPRFQRLAMRFGQTPMVERSIDAACRQPG